MGRIFLGGLILIRFARKCMLFIVISCGNCIENLCFWVDMKWVFIFLAIGIGPVPIPALSPSTDLNVSSAILLLSPLLEIRGNF